MRDAKTSTAALAPGEYRARLIDLSRTLDDRHDPKPVRWRLEIVDEPHAGLIVEDQTFMHTKASRGYTKRRFERLLGGPVEDKTTLEHLRQRLLGALVLLVVRHDANGRVDYYLGERLPDPPNGGVDELGEFDISI